MPTNIFYTFLIQKNCTIIEGQVLRVPLATLAASPTRLPGARSPISPPSLTFGTLSFPSAALRLGPPGSNPILVGLSFAAASVLVGATRRALTRTRSQPLGSSRGASGDFDPSNIPEDIPDRDWAPDAYTRPDAPEPGRDYDVQNSLDPPSSSTSSSYLSNSMSAPPSISSSSSSSSFPNTDETTKISDGDDSNPAPLPAYSYETPPARRFRSPIPNMRIPSPIPTASALLARVSSLGASLRRRLVKTENENTRPTSDLSASPISPRSGSKSITTDTSSSTSPSHSTPTTGYGEVSPPTHTNQTTNPAPPLPPPTAVPMYTTSVGAPNPNPFTDDQVGTVVISALRRMSVPRDSAKTDMDGLSVGRVVVAALGGMRTQTLSDDRVVAVGEAVILALGSLVGSRTADGELSEQDRSRVGGAVRIILGEDWGVPTLNPGTATTPGRSSWEQTGAQTGDPAIATYPYPHLASSTILSSSATTPYIETGSEMTGSDLFSPTSYQIPAPIPPAPDIVVPQPEPPASPTYPPAYYPTTLPPTPTPAHMDVDPNDLWAEVEFDEIEATWAEIDRFLAIDDLDEDETGTNMNTNDDVDTKAMIHRSAQETWDEADAYVAAIMSQAESDEGRPQRQRGETTDGPTTKNAGKDTKMDVGMGMDVDTDRATSSSGRRLERRTATEMRALYEGRELDLDVGPGLGPTARPRSRPPPRSFRANRDTPGGHSPGPRPPSRMGGSRSMLLWGLMALPGLGAGSRSS